MLSSHLYEESGLSFDDALSISDRLLSGQQTPWIPLPSFYMTFWDLRATLHYLLSQDLVVNHQEITYSHLYLLRYVGQRKPHNLSARKEVSTGQKPKCHLSVLLLKSAQWIPAQKLDTDAVCSETRAVSSFFFLLHHHHHHRQRGNLPRSRSKVTNMLLLLLFATKFTVLTRAVIFTPALSWAPSPQTRSTTLLPTCCKAKALPFRLYTALTTGHFLQWGCTDVSWRVIQRFCLAKFQQRCVFTASLCQTVCLNARNFHMSRVFLSFSQLDKKQLHNYVLSKHFIWPS